MVTLSPKKSSVDNILDQISGLRQLSHKNCLLRMPSFAHCGSLSERPLANKMISNLGNQPTQTQGSRFGLTSRIKTMRTKCLRPSFTFVSTCFELSFALRFLWIVVPIEIFLPVPWFSSRSNWLLPCPFFPTVWTAYKLHPTMALPQPGTLNGNRFWERRQLECSRIAVSKNDWKPRVCNQRRVFC